MLIDPSTVEAGVVTLVCGEPPVVAFRGDADIRVRHEGKDASLVGHIDADTLIRLARALYAENRKLEIAARYALDYELDAGESCGSKETIEALRWALDEEYDGDYLPNECWREEVG